ncbi:hypothetical protein BDW59DRAFT_174109 [Aspergillus cavernicola]|uniref:Uncharacterized protein n=1 Tax=Aspergillus cavernicola TaxID=176166 RepID=A0ABR4I1Z3_9EURO
MDHGITVFHKDEALQQKQKEAVVKKPKRGPLDINEQFALIKVCEKRAKFKEISDIVSKNFWVGIEVALEREIGRRYSHFSCRRRINEFIAQRAVYRDSIKSGQPLPFQPMDPEIRRMLDSWKEMDEFKEQLEKEKALSQLVGHATEVPQTKKLQRVADWVKSLPDPEPQSVITPPSTDSSPPPVKQDEAMALWARYRKVEEDRAMVRSTQLRALNQELASSRQLLSNIKHQLTSTIQDPRAMQVLTGVKRPREDEEFPLDRAAPRPRTQITDQDSSRPMLKQSPGNSQVLLRSEVPPVQLQSPFDSVFSKFWDNMLPYFKERAMKDGLNITKSESIMHELFKEVGSAMTRAFMKLEQNTRPSAHNTLL